GVLVDRYLLRNSTEMPSLIDFEAPREDRYHFVVWIRVLLVVLSEFLGVIGYELETSAVRIKDLAAARAVQIATIAGLHGVTDADICLVLVETGKFPWRA